MVFSRFLSVDSDSILLRMSCGDYWSLLFLLDMMCLKLIVIYNERLEGK